MSFGSQSSVPWQRNIMQGHVQSGGFHQGTQMFMPNSQQNNMAAFSHGGLQSGASGSMYSAGGAGGGGNSVSYPQPRSGLNPVAFQQGGGAQSHYNSIGAVTKVSNDCGLINDEVFFYRNVCKGHEPILGDRVMFEATYSSNGQFKWNATRVQLLQQHQQPQSLMGSSKGGYSSAAPPNEYRGQIRHNSPKRSPIRGRNERDRRERERERIHRSRERDEDELERKRRREDHGRSRDRLTSTASRGGAGGHVGRNEIDRDRVESRKKEREIAEREREREERERERERAREKELQVAGPKGRRARAIRRYMVQIPKALLTHKFASVQDLRQRYTTLYIPSDFFHANIKWSDSFTPDNSFSLRRPCRFHIMHKQVDSPIDQSLDLLEPADANYLYSAKVMLMSLPPIAEIYEKAFESNDDDIDHHPSHPTHLINFLVGIRGRNEPMAIGGPWSPSLDGENPDKDPSVLIRTAIRTCKALTGIDLSNCTQWYRFVELYYHRTEYKNMEKDGPPRVETVVFYLPDVHSCIPSIKEWQTLTQNYKKTAEDVIARRAALVAAATAANPSDDNGTTNDVDMADSTLAGEGEEDVEENFDADESVQNLDDEEAVDVEPEDEKMDDSTITASDGAIVIEIDEDEDAEAAEGEELEEDETNAEAEDENGEPTPEPTHYSLLDLKSMKVQDIRDELLARNLPDKGVRNVVMARLAKALNTEKAEEVKNKGKNKQQLKQTMPQKSETVKKLSDSSTKEKMETGQGNSAADEKNKKKLEKKDADVKVSDDEKSKVKPTDEKKNSDKGKRNKEEQDEWGDVFDFEMSDIVILDEYDSSKNPEENLSKEMNEREKAQLIRRYTLPTSPQILVHPNRFAKDGKFDCAIMSLSVLLDYRPDDAKERFFEISLFAELFNEMLMRDFAFNIYKEIYLYNESINPNESAEVKTEDDNKKEKTESDDAKKVDKDKEIKKEVKEKQNENEKTSKKETKSNNEISGSSEKNNKETHNDETQSLKNESRKRKHSTSTNTANGKDNESSATEKKMVVVKPQLLLSFVYFDTTHCGYIFEKDLEDLFMVIGLNLSRSQIKKVLGKLATRQAVYYRKLTDKEESTESIPSMEDADNIPIEELQRIAVGNNKYEFVFGNSDVCNQVSKIEYNESEDGLTNYNGTVVHVGKLISQIKRTEKNYSDLEKVYNDLLKQISDLQKEHKSQKSKIDTLTSKNKTLTKKLTDTNQDLYSINRKYRDLNTTLSYIYTRVSPYFTREDNKTKEAKAESSRDKEKDEKEKNSDKEKSKAKEGKDDKDKKNDKEKEKPKEEKEKEKLKDDKEKEKNKDDNEKPKEVKEIDKPPKDNKEKDKAKEDTEKEKAKDDKEKEKSKEDKEKEKPKDNKEKEKPKEIKEKEKPKDDKEKEKPKDDKEKNKPKEKPVTKDEKVKVAIKDNKEKLSKDKDVTLNASQKEENKAKKTPESKTTGKVIKKADSAAKK